MADRYTYSGNDRIPVITLREALKRRGFPIEHLKVDDYVLRRADEILVACKDNWTAYLNEGGKPWAYVGMSTKLFALAECKPEDRADTNYCWITSTSYAVVVDKTESWPGMIFSLVLPC